ncbi:MAG: c-type cytochrome [Alphaproteobacteria bacterium]
MRVSHFLGAAICAGALVLAGNAVSEEASDEPEREPSAENGEALFTERCSVCHTGAVAPAPADLGKHDAETFDKKVQEHAEVGAFDGLTAENLDDIYAWLQTQAAESSE